MERKAVPLSPIQNLANSARIVVIHDGMATGLAAQQWLDAKLCTARPDVRFWGHEIVAHGELWQRLGEDVAGADALVFALSSRTILPLRIVHWLTSWEEGGQVRAVRFGLLDSTDAGGGSLSRMARTFMRGFARRHCGVFFYDFLSRTERLPALPEIPRHRLTASGRPAKFSRIQPARPGPAEGHAQL